MKLLNNFNNSLVIYYIIFSNIISGGFKMKNVNLKRRIASAAAAAVVSVSCIGATVNGGAYQAAVNSQVMNAFAANSSVVFTASKGCLESVYAEWAPVSNATGYNVYCDGVQIDSMLIRQYSGYFRADAVGIKAGSHTLKVVPVIGGKEDSSKAASVELTASAHDRTGFGFVNGTSSGAYNEDGTLKSDAIVVYVTDENKDSVKASIDSTGKGAAEIIGVQNIITGYKKGKEPRPLCLRFIGNITDPANMPNGDLYVDGVTAGLTIEGIGNDTVFNGFGLVMKNSSNVEVRNIGFMNCNSTEGDDCGLQQKNDHVWVHNCDFFYGDAGSDADQVKGDGALDTKTSTYVTHSYNHFWDNGKCNLQGMKSEATTNYITYHHNWYDHSDSRHPRIRTCTVHIYNNYFDGNAKYGIGVTMGASAFVENNYFRKCNYPMIISKQATDAAAGEILSGETGGIIKAYGNYMEGQKAFVPYSENNTDFDAYIASSRDEKVPSSVTCKNGGTSYNNFDTDSSLMYSYNVESPEDAKANIMAYAGRVDGGDLKWTFDNSVDDESYAVNTGLKNALTNYKPAVVAIGSGFKEDSGSQPVVTTITTANPQIKTTITTTTSKQQPIVTNAPVTGSSVIYCSPKGGGDGKTISTPTDVITAIKSVKAGGTIYLLDGTYNFNETIIIDEQNSGSAGAMKTISAYPGAKVTWDFSSLSVSGTNRGVVLDGAYWHFYGFEIARAGDNGMLLSGDNNKIEMMVFNDNQDTGLQISRYQTSYNTIAQWPSNNLILNCTSKNNCDNATMENADGFAAKLTCGEGNVFDGCMAYNNSDDGWDLFAKTETGPIGVVTLQNCVAFRNGFTEFGEGYGQCDGNGFKLGGSGVGSAHVVKNCLAFENLNCGFTDNNNPKLGSLTDCTAYNNGVGGNGKPNYSLYRCTDDGCDFKNIISYNNTSKVSSLGAAGIKISNDKFVGTMENSVYYNSKYYNVANKVDIANGSKIGTVVTPSDSEFITLSAPAMGTDFHTAWRNADGSVNTGGFAETNKTYKNMGYHFNSSSQPIVTTSTSKTQITTTTTTTTKSGGTQQPVVSGGYIHDFTANGTNSSFYTITGNLSTSKGTVNYAGKTLTQCLKLESASNIAFSAANGGSLTLVFAEPNATIKVDGTKYTSSGDGIITVELKSGAHTVTKADSANLFYMVYAENGTTVTTASTSAVTTTTTTTTTSQPIEPDIIYGDVNENGEVDITDAAKVMSYVTNPEKYSLTEKQLDIADVYQRGDGISNMDALSIRKRIAQLVASLPESFS